MHVVTGSKTLRAAGHTWDLGPGDTVFLKKSVSFLRQNTDDEVCLFVFFIPDEFVRATVREMASDLPVLAPPAEPRDVAIRVHHDTGVTAFLQAMTVFFAASGTPPENLPAYRPGLGRVATFSIHDGRQFRSAPPPPLGSKRYARDYEEVKRVGEARSQERPEDRTQVARFYDATDGEQIYYPAARQVAATRSRTLSQNARLFALLAIAMWDSAVACFETKYHFNLWRPVTAIREAGTDGNHRTAPDPEWQAAVFTPPFPAYPSGHAAFGGAARAVLEEEFGLDGHAITLTNPVVPEIVLTYTSFEQITDDIDDGRIYGGVHYRFDQEAGALMGKQVADYILSHTLRPVKHH
jgi:hypothetical protein